MLKILQRLLPEKIKDERELRSTVQLLKTLLAIFLAASGIGLGLAIIGPHKLALGIPLAVLLVLGITCLVLLRRGKLLPVQVLLPASLFIFTTYIVINGNGLHEVGLITYAIVIAMAGLTLGQEATLAFGFLIAISVIGIGIAEMQGALVNRASFLTNITAPFNLAVIVAAIAFIQRTLIQRSNEAIRHEYENKQAQILANAELLNLKGGLETQIEERTEQLQSANTVNIHRANQFETIVQVTSAINSIRNTGDLLPKIASVVSEQFNYYHVGIFLNDENNQFTYLTASNSQGGQRMLEHGHNLKIGEQGIVGYVAGSGIQRVAHNVGEDVVYFNNPNLPETKSEMALPLRSSNKVIGVLDVQSRKADVFSPEDIRVLGILADQISLAIDNTRLYETTRRSLEEAEALYRQYLRQAWSRLPREQQLAGFRYNQRVTTPLEIPVVLDAEEKRGGEKVNEEGARLNVPIKLRGETIGNLIVHVAQDRRWNQDQVDLVEAVADRVALSAENARLFDETNRRAERERMVTEITSKIRSTNDPEAMIQTALDELRNALGATQVQLIPQALSASEQNQSEIISSTPQDSVQKPQRGNGAKK